MMMYGQGGGLDIYIQGWKQDGIHSGLESEKATRTIDSFFFFYFGIFPGFLR